MCPVRSKICIIPKPARNLKKRKAQYPIWAQKLEAHKSLDPRLYLILLSICTYSLHGKKSLVGWWYFIWQISRLKWSSSSSAGKFCNFENWEENGKNVGQSTFLHEIVVVSCCLIKIVHCTDQLSVCVYSSTSNID